MPVKETAATAPDRQTQPPRRCGNNQGGSATETHSHIVSDRRQLIGFLAKRAPVAGAVNPKLSTETVSGIVRNLRSQTQKISDLT